MQHLDAALTQVNVAALLGTLRASKLGHYPRRGLGHWFKDDAVNDQLDRFQDALAGIDTIIAQRNRARPRYDYLRPSLIPQSIDI
jgi:hypothetical protein